MLGPPGAGKGTQAVRIAETYDVPKITTGDILRANVREGTELGARAQGYMDEGELVPDELVIAMVEDRLSRPDAADGFVLDGFPRTLPQARALRERTGDDHAEADAVLRLQVPPEELVERLTGRRVCRREDHTYHLSHQPPEQPGVCDIDGSELHQREDDRREVVERRLAVYREETAPLVAFYRERGMLRDVDAVGPVGQVTERALAVLRTGDDTGGST